MKTFLLLAFAVMWIADTLFTTRFVLDHGVDLEANPVMHYVIKEYGLLTTRKYGTVRNRLSPSIALAVA